MMRTSWKTGTDQHTDGNGIRRHVFLLDEMLELDNNVGLISENYAEKLVSGITTKSYGACAREISESTFGKSQREIYNEWVLYVEKYEN